MRRAARFAREPEVVPGELNLVPYLDIMVNLILFLLLTFSTLTAFSIPLKIAGVGGETTIADGALTVAIVPEGFRILGDEGTEPALVPLAGGTHDFAALTAELTARKRALGLGSRVTVVADGAAGYGLVVSTLDAARSTQAGGVLFPDVSFGTVAGG